MRILYIHQYFTTPAGATGTRSFEMAQRLLAAGHEVVMVCSSADIVVTGLQGPFVDGQRRGMVDGIDVIEFDLGYSNYDGMMQRAKAFLRFAFGATRAALRERYDLLFATTTPLTVAIPALIAKFLRGKRYVFEVRDLWPEVPRAMGKLKNPIVYGLLTALEWASYRGAHSLIALSPGMAEGIVRHGVDPKRIESVPNGSDIALFQDNVTPWRPDGIPADALMAVFAGAHGRANSLDDILDAAAEVKRRGRDDIRFVMAGDGAMKPGLVARAKAEGIDNILFLDPIPKTKVAQLFRAGDVGLQVMANLPTFHRSTSPNKFFDYLSAGLPVLNNYPGWLAGMIEEEDCGFVVPPANPAAFADALEAAADDRAALKAKGERSLALAKREFARDKLGSKFVNWLEAADPTK